MANVVTPEFRVSYPKVFKPENNKLSGKTEFSVVALFSPKSDLSKLKAAAQAAIEEKWGKDKAKWPKQLKTPFRLQDEKEKDGMLPPGHEKGGVFMNLKSAQKPAVVDQQVQPILDETQFYGGCYAIASVRAYAYDQAGNRGVSFGLVNIQKTRDGDTFGNRTKPEQDFAPIESPAGEEAKDATDLFS